MRRWLTALLALALALALAGCGGGESGRSASGGGNVGSGDGDVYAEDGWAEGRMGDTMHTYFFNYTVNSAYTCGEFAGRAAADSCKLLVVEITVKNTSTASVEMYDTDFQAQWGGRSEKDYRVPVTTDPETLEELEPLSDEQLPGTYELAVNQERTGLLVYEVPDGIRDFSVSHMELFEDGEEGDTFFVYFTAEEG